MGSAELFTSSATSAATFLIEKAAAFQRCFLSKYSAAAATPNKLLPRLFLIHIFTRYRLESLLSVVRSSPRYFRLVEHTRLPL